jgi:hypothetical protein
MAATQSREIIHDTGSPDRAVIKSRYVVEYE